MIDDYETKLEEVKKQNQYELEILRKRMNNHIDELGNNILIRFPYLVELPTPIIDFFDKDDSFVLWLRRNIDEHDYSRPWPHLVYFKNGEDAVAFKLRWI